MQSGRSLRAKITGGPTAEKGFQCPKTYQKAVEAEVTVSGKKEWRMSLGRPERASFDSGSAGHSKNVDFEEYLTGK